MTKQQLETIHECADATAIHRDTLIVIVQLLRNLPGGHGKELDDLQDVIDGMAITHTKLVLLQVRDDD